MSDSLFLAVLPRGLATEYAPSTEVDDRETPVGGYRTNQQPFMLTRAEVDAILEVVFLAAHADGRIAQEEAVAYMQLLKRLTGSTLSRLERRDVMLPFVGGEHMGGRLIELGARLVRTPARDIAYKLSVALSMVDNASTDAEDRFDRLLLRALNISADDETRLFDETMQAVGGA